MLSDKELWDFALLLVEASDKDKKAQAADLQRILDAAPKDEAFDIVLAVTERVNRLVLGDDEAPLN
jgi:hypothetical protein